MGQEARLNITLQVGEIHQEMTVTGGSPMVETENATIGAVMTQTAIQELPLNGRNAMQLGVLTAGVNESNGSRQASQRGFAPAAGGESVAENR